MLKEFVLVVTVLANPQQKFDDTFIYDKFKSEKACKIEGKQVEREFAYYEEKKIKWHCEILSTD